MSSSTGSSNGNGNVAGRHPLYRGVRQRKSGGKWVSEIRVPRTPNRIWLGSFSSPEMAAIAYDVAALALKGPRAEINFPNAAASLPVPASTSPRDIQAAAASAASAAGAAADAWTGHASSAAAVNVGKNMTQSYQNMGVSEFVDEDLTFDMPNVLANMAQGMLLSPPRVHIPSDDNTAEYSGEESLWNYPY